MPSASASGFVPNDGSLGPEMSRLEEQIFLECTEERRTPRGYSAGAGGLALTIGAGLSLLLGIAVASLMGFGFGVVAFSLGMALVLLANPWSWRREPTRGSRRPAIARETRASSRRRRRSPTDSRGGRVPATDRAAAP